MKLRVSSVACDLIATKLESPSNADIQVSPKESSTDFAGTFRITDMEMWDEDYFNMEVQAYVRIDDNGFGDFQFGLVSGSIDGYVEDVGSERRFTFTWKGRDEMDPVSGSGWLRQTGDDQAEGMIKFHKGDRSRFQARRVA